MQFTIRELRDVHDAWKEIYDGIDSSQDQESYNNTIHNARIIVDDFLEKFANLKVEV